MFAHQIFNDFKENAEVSSAKDLKSNTIGKPKSTGLKNATNTAPNKRIIKSDSNLKKNKIKEENPTTSKQGSVVSEASEDWPEKENMYIYNEPEDDYEDLMPKTERITQKDIEALFEIPQFVFGIDRYPDDSEDEAPFIPLQLMIDSFGPSFEIDRDMQ